MGMGDLAMVAAATGGRLIGPNAVFDSVTTDTRGLWPGQLFVALRGERHDAANFVSAAAAAGAAGAVVERQQPVALPQVEVADSRGALGALARHWRSRFSLPVVAITGSNGKTTVKEMTASILRARTGGPTGDDSPVHATRGNLNNDVGLPITLLWLREWHRYAVLEMGASHQGSIAYLVGLGIPDAAIITNAGPAHLEGFGATVADVARAKGEIIAGIREGGVAVLNRDDPFFDYWRGLAAGRRVWSFGLSPAADFHATDVKVGATLQFRLHSPGGDVAISLPMAGRHNVRNALAAAAATLAVGATLTDVQAGLAATGNVSGRLRAVPGPRGSTIYDDSYNANPGSVAAAIEFLAALPGARWLALGDMRELGPDERALHRQVGELARQAGLDRFYAVGELCREAAAGFGSDARWYPDLPPLVADLGRDLGPGVTLLVKGSRGMGMERLVTGLTGAEPEVSH